MQQGDADWLAIKAGKISGSRFAAVMALHKRTGKPNRPRLDLIADLRRELETGLLTSIEPNEYMAHGTRCEPIACALYAFTHDVDVQHAAVNANCFFGFYFSFLFLCGGAASVGAGTPPTMLETYMYQRTCPS